MEYNGRVYVYTTNDVIEYDSNGNVTENTYAQVNKINCISSDDMVNWTDHGAIPVAGASGIAKWADCSWAPCAAHKTINGKEKFFLYFCNVNFFLVFSFLYFLYFFSCYNLLVFI